MKLIMDSASDLWEYSKVKNFQSVPIYIRTDDKEFTDDANLDVLGMIGYLEGIKGRSGSACPGVDAYLGALEGEKDAIIVTLAEELSGSYNAAYTAAGLYTEENENTTVYVINSNGIGPTEKLAADKFAECDEKGMDVDSTYDCVNDYVRNHVNLGFCLKSLKNLANNGRINPVIAKIATVVGIRVVGHFSEWGEIQPTHKARGEKKAIECMYLDMEEAGYKGGRVIIDHCDGLELANSLKDEILRHYPDADILISTTTGLCSFYAERGGLIFSYER